MSKPYPCPACGGPAQVENGSYGMEVLQCQEAACGHVSLRTEGKGGTSLTPPERLKQRKLPGLDPGIQEVVLPTPTEAQEMELLFQRVAWNLHRHPELAWLFHIPNGGAREHTYYTDKKTGKTRRYSKMGQALKRQGVKPGFPDTALLRPSGIYHGAMIEVKRIGEPGPKEGDDQDAWLRNLAAEGYFTAVCWGGDQTFATYVRYLTEPETLRPYGVEEEAVA